MISLHRALLSESVLVAVLALTAPSVNADAPPFLWLITPHGEGAEVARGIAADSGGNTYTVATFTSTNLDFRGGISLTNSNPSSSSPKNSFIVKYSSNGNLLWVKRLGGSDNISANAIALDSQTNLYITGSFGTNLVIESITVTNHSAPGNAGIFTAKFDSSGNPLWIRTADTGQSQAGSSIAVDAAGNCYVTGNISGTNTFSGATLISPGALSILLLKYNSAGTLLWARTAGGSNRDTGNAVAAESTGNVWIAAALASSNSAFANIVLTGTNPGSDIGLAKYDSAGNVLWAERFGGPAVETATGIAVDKNGNAYLTGAFGSSNLAFGNITLTNNYGVPNGALFLAKFDAYGNPLWAKGAHGNYNVWSSAVTVDFLGNPYITGFFQSDWLFFDIIALMNSDMGLFNDADVFITKFDPDGNKLWCTQPMGQNEQRAFALAVDPAANTYIAGWTQGTNVVFGPFSTTNVYLDLFVTKIDSDYPLLQISRTNTSVVVSWPANRPDFILEFSTNFQNWVPLTAPVLTNPPSKFVTNSTAFPQAFFRLRK